jgi:hypothetical protein
MVSSTATSFSTCTVSPATFSLCSASERDVNKLWECFNDVAEGFGLNQDELVEICRSMQQTLEIHARSEMDQLSSALFTALDTDEVTNQLQGGRKALKELFTLTFSSFTPRLLLSERPGGRARVPRHDGHDVGHAHPAETHLYASKCC